MLFLHSVEKGILDIFCIQHAKDLYNNGKFLEKFWFKNNGFLVTKTRFRKSKGVFELQLLKRHPKKFVFTL